MNFQLDHIYKSYVEKCENRDVSMWTNVNEVGSKNVIHSHKPDAWGGIYYVQGEGTGNLVFHNPANLLSDCNPTSPFTRKMELEQRWNVSDMGGLGAFYEVEENKSNKQRINIAWGINFK